MFLIVIAWTYIALMMAVVEATSSNGTILGAVITFLLYGALPVSLVIYLFGRPGRRRRREIAERAANEASVDPDAGRQTAADAITPVRKEP